MTPMESAPATLVESAVVTSDVTPDVSRVESSVESSIETTPESTPGLGGSFDAAVAEELLVEEISIDGMCGVY